MASKAKLKRKLAKLKRKYWIQQSDMQIAIDRAEYRAHFAELQSEQLANENTALRHEVESLRDEMDSLHDELEDLRLELKFMNGTHPSDEAIEQTQTNTPAYTNGEDSVPQMPCS